MSEELVNVISYPGVAAAELAKMRLEEAGLTVFLRDVETIQTNWLLGNAIGNVKVMVPQSQVPAAMKIVEEMEAEQRRRAAYVKNSYRSNEEPCLACGKPFPEDADQCPSCGWSFAEDAKE